MYSYIQNRVPNWPCWKGPVLNLFMLIHESLFLTENLRAARIGLTCGMQPVRNQFAHCWHRGWVVQLLTGFPNTGRCDKFIHRSIRQWCIDTKTSQSSSGMKRRATSVKCNSLPAGTASQPEVQSGASTRSPWSVMTIVIPRHSGLFSMTLFGRS